MGTMGHPSWPAGPAFCTERSPRCSPTRTGRSWRRTRCPPVSTTPALARSTRTCATRAVPATSRSRTSTRCGPSASSPGSRASCRRSSPRTRSPGSWVQPNRIPPNQLTLRIRGRDTTWFVSAGAETRTWLRSSSDSASSMVEVTMAGAERIGAAFAAARAEGRAALMPYLMGGFPDLGASLAIADAYADAGADLVELGVPFSDPLADGPVIHAAATHALAGGATLGRVLEVCERLASKVPVVPMVYSNMLVARGAGESARLLADAGAAGAIVPDLPLEEAGEIAAELDAAGIALIPLVAPTTPAERRRRICAGAKGFVYVVSDTRVTGERDELPAGLGRRGGGQRLRGGRGSHSLHPHHARRARRGLIAISVR